jgi:hypothetical protein
MPISTRSRADTRIGARDNAASLSRQEIGYWQDLLDAACDLAAGLRGKDNMR